MVVVVVAGRGLLIIMPSGYYLFCLVFLDDSRPLYSLIRFFRQVRRGVNLILPMPRSSTGFCYPRALSRIGFPSVFSLGRPDDEMLLSPPGCGSCLPDPTKATTKECD